MSGLFKRPKIVQTSPPPPPPPKPIPVETAPDVRAAQLEIERGARSRKGRQSTLLDDSLGAGMYNKPKTQKATLG